MKKIRAVTLVELMIVVAIIGILAAVVMPSYRNYVLESQREDAKAQMLQILQLQERYLLNNNTYTTDLSGDLSYPNPFELRYGDNVAFTIEARICDGATPISECVRVIAVPDGDQTEDGGLAADSRGRRVHEFAGNVPRDWHGNPLVGGCPECLLF